MVVSCRGSDYPKVLLESATFFSSAANEPIASFGAVAFNKSRCSQSRSRPLFRFVFRWRRATRSITKSLSSAAKSGMCPVRPAVLVQINLIILLLQLCLDERLFSERLDCSHDFISFKRSMFLLFTYSSSFFTFVVSCGRRGCSRYSTFAKRPRQALAELCLESVSGSRAEKREKKPLPAKYASAKLCQQT